MILLTKKLAVKIASIAVAVTLMVATIGIITHKPSKFHSNNQSKVEIEKSTDKQQVDETKTSKQEQQVVELFHNIANFHEEFFKIRSEINNLSNQISDNYYHPALNGSNKELDKKELDKKAIQDFRNKFEDLKNNRMDQLNKFNSTFTHLAEKFSTNTNVPNYLPFPVLKDKGNAALCYSLDACIESVKDLNNFYNDIAIVLNECDSDIYATT